MSSPSLSRRITTPNCRSKASLEDTAGRYLEASATFDFLDRELQALLYSIDVNFNESHVSIIPVVFETHD